MVLLSLFVGIIITSMELLKEGIKEEKEVWGKVKVKQKQYNMREATIKNLLEIFDLIDIGENGKLTVRLPCSHPPWLPPPLLPSSSPLLPSSSSPMSCPHLLSALWSGLVS
jgi:hypothetical protein